MMYPLSRPRRLRTKDFLRRLSAENSLSPADFIMPLFVCENKEDNLEIAAMPGQSRVPIKDLGKKAKMLHSLGIPAIALFPYIPAKLKTEYAAQAYNNKGLIPQAIAAVKDAVPQIGVITDVALDPYTTHGHDGVTNARGEVINDATLHFLCRQALCLVEAGSDIVAPSDMMDGRVRAIREMLESKGHYHVPILAYTAKYASSFYAPFRDAIGSVKNLASANKLSYQMSPPNSEEAVYEASLDIEEGADILMVKPANLYSDIILRLRDKFNIPVFAYQVSGEYSMFCHLGGDDEQQAKAVMMESLICLKRAGASAIMTYFAESAAKALDA